MKTWVCSSASSTSSSWPHSSADSCSSRTVSVCSCCNAVSCAPNRRTASSSRSGTAAARVASARSIACSASDSLELAPAPAGAPFSPGRRPNLTSTSATPSSSGKSCTVGISGFGRPPAATLPKASAAPSASSSASWSSRTSRLSPYLPPLPPEPLDTDAALPSSGMNAAPSGPASPHPPCSSASRRARSRSDRALRMSSTPGTSPSDASGSSVPSAACDDGANFVSARSCCR
mmetsp:Transcript_67462/g.163064  ORF Transcript_67462/g.163064 Transcript_67462/m.163064 type:complete len:233 (+) Transcript_67462:284-982(+)